MQKNAERIECIRKLLDLNLPLAALEASVESNSYVEETEKEFQRKKLQSISLPTPLDLGYLMVEQLKNDGHKLAAVTVAEAYGLPPPPPSDLSVSCKLYEVVGVGTAVFEAGLRPTAKEKDKSLKELEDQVQRLEASLAEQTTFLPRQQEDICSSVLELTAPIAASIPPARRGTVIPLLESLIIGSPGQLRRSATRQLVSLYQKPCGMQRKLVVDAVRRLVAGSDGIRHEHLVEEIAVQIKDDNAEQRCLALCLCDILPSCCERKHRLRAMKIVVDSAHDPHPTVRLQSAECINRFLTETNADEEFSLSEVWLRFVLDNDPSVERAAKESLKSVVESGLKRPADCGGLIALMISAVAQVCSVESQFSRDPSEQIGGRLLNVLSSITEHTISKLDSDMDIYQKFSESMPRFYSMLLAFMKSPSGKAHTAIVFELFYLVGKLAFSFGYEKALSLSRVVFNVLDDDSHNDLHPIAVGALFYHHSTCPAKGQELVSRVIGETAVSVLQCRVGWPNDDMLHSLITNVVKNELPSSVLMATALWCCTQHSAENVRASSIGLFLQLARVAPPHVTEKNIWPALLVLMNDASEAVQGDAIRGACALATIVAEGNMLETIFSTSISVVCERERVTPATHALLQGLCLSMRSISSDTREKHVYPFMPTLCAQFLRSGGVLNREESALVLREMLQVFTAISSCAVASPFHTEKYLLPSLRLLGSHYQCCDDAVMKQQFSSVLKDLSMVAETSQPKTVERSLFDKIRKELNNVVKKAEQNQ